MATETEEPTGDGTEGTAVPEETLAVRDRIQRRRRLRWILLVVVVVGVLALTGLALLLIEFTLAELVRQFPSWTEFLGAFLSPDFEDFTKLTRDQRINSVGSLLPVVLDVIHLGPLTVPMLQLNPAFDPLGVFRPIIASLLNPGTFVESLASETNLVGAAVVTLAIGFAGTVFGLPLALSFGILGSERVTPFPFNFLFRGVMSTIRAVPALVWILIYVPLVGVSPVGAFLAVATDTVGNLGRLFTDELEEIQDGPIEAVRSTGASRPQTVLFGMLSQVSNSFIAWTLYILEINVRIAISLGVVGAGGIGQYIQLNVQQFRYGKAAAGIFMVIVIVLTVELVSSRLRARLRPGEGEGKGLLEALRDLGDANRWLGTGTE